jgi:hypothetical protein
MQVREGVEVFTTGDETGWIDVLEEVGDYHFVHMPAFHRLAEIRGEGKAVMPVFREEGFTAAFPMLLRDIDIPGVSSGGGLKDATSVSGFAGPLVSSENIPENIRQSLLQQLHSFLEQEKVVAAFSRLNPVLNQSAFLEGYGQIVERGVTLAIDLTIPQEEQFARYIRNHRQDVKSLRKNGFTCEEAGTEYLDEFTRIYCDTMQRVQAEDLYCYEKSYHEYLLREMPDVMHLFICKDGNTTASVMMFACCRGIAEAYLAGTASEYLRFSPAKLIFDTVRIWACEAGAKVLHLGGGVGAARDSLYNFKLGFGAEERVYATWRHIIDQNTYDDLCRVARSRTGGDPDNNFFPQYRSQSEQCHMEDG